MADTRVWQLEMLSNLLGVTGNFGVKEDSSKEGTPVWSKWDGSGVVKGSACIATCLGRTSSRDKSVFSHDPQEAALIDQWLEYKVSYLDRCTSEKDLHNALQELNGYLSDRVYLVTSHMTLADLVLYYGLYDTMKGLTFYEKERFIHLSRWFNNIKNISTCPSGS
ncbi:eukaryotic translation elongation factor 1 epsilon-1-like isoform X2 [Liolophura sinensis]|uniref:eukaryotic translation elongation factor 1 epsilon-1-like isoform X2 n=1 Tax=Liolophura sinensis TaxID=3198878 RepID=UPI003158E4F4